MLATGGFLPGDAVGEGLAEGGLVEDAELAAISPLCSSLSDACSGSFCDGTLMQSFVRLIAASNAIPPAAATVRPENRIDSII